MDIALTFDDGPNTTNTVRVLNELEARGIVATFFVIGKNINEQSAKVMKRGYALGCEYANHSWSWESLADATPDAITESITKTSDKIVEVLGAEAAPRFFRAPNLSISPQMTEAVKNIGFPLINGIVGNDWEPAATPQSIYNMIVPNVTDGSILLLHDGESNAATAEGMGEILDTLISRGFRFATLSELFEIKSVEIKPGKIYNDAG